jgi:DNA-nicking Smr family endonuclease
MKRNSKNNKQTRGTGAFQNAPFKMLKGISTGAPASLASSKAAPKTPSREVDEDDDQLFLRSVSGARPIDREIEEGPGPTSPVQADQQPGDDEIDGKIFLQAMGSLKTTTFRDEAPELEDEAPSRSTSSRMRQLKRGTIHIGEELDLHGFLKDEALKRLEQFITSAYVRGSQAVLVITGKGLNSPEGPVLPGAVDAWLRRQGKVMVAEFLPAPRDKGGSGAIVVFLRKREN